MIAAEMEEVVDLIVRHQIIDRTNSSTVLQASFSSERPSLRDLISTLRA